MLELFPSRTIFLSIFGYSIHWYGVMYALAFWIAYALLPKLGELRGIKISRDQWTMLIAYAGIGVL
ncbi:MAG: prolipoprotein diacylglyceryl transferase family protein, partial [Candidatus Andersenbacteria bacterium]